MCTTYLGWKIIMDLKEEGIEIEDFPRLIRLNPFARFKTRGNGAVSFKINLNNNENNNENNNIIKCNKNINNINENNENKKNNNNEQNNKKNNEKQLKTIKIIKNIVKKNIDELSMIECKNTNPGVVFYEGEITKEMENYALKAIHSIITIEEAEEFAAKIGAEIYKLKLGRGIIGSIAAIACPLEDFTYELLTYRIKENYGMKRQIDEKSVYLMNKKTYPNTFENIDNEYIAIEPHTSCPILYGIRGESKEVLKIAKDLVKVNEEIQGYMIYKTNQHTDMHLKKIDKIVDMEKYGSYIVKGTVSQNPYVIEGGHVFFTLKDDYGKIKAAAFEPTKDFRKIIEKLKEGDIVELYGGIGCGESFNIEKIKIIQLKKIIKYENPICECGKRMTSAGSGKGFKCKNCGHRLRDGEKIAIEENRELEENKFYETPVSARRHLAKPLVRFQNKDNLKKKVKRINKIF
ncbi:MAG: tRNA(Ile)(2)-agmatinylcytidine synthase [Methanobrevibacter sp.]|jgi:tRNA(Ile2)-agmatinylcytidine synthase|nr:tRNA(Ile)(2)-agmatinylcytidine synthase [Candidatus Methanoflexus mossambicus]